MSTFDLIIRIVFCIAALFLLHELYILIRLFLWDREKNRPFKTDGRVNGTKEYAGSLVKIRCETAGRNVKISWQFKESIRQRGFQLVGWRMENDRRSDNGERHIVGHDDGHIFDPIELGKTYRYRFEIKKSYFSLLTNFGAESRTMDTVTFLFNSTSRRETIDELDHELEIQERRERLALRNELRKKALTDPIDAQIDRVCKAVKGDLRLGDMLDDLEGELIDEINRVSSSASEKRENISRLHLKIRQA